MPNPSSAFADYFAKNRISKVVIRGCDEFHCKRHRSRIFKNVLWTWGDVAITIIDNGHGYIFPFWRLESAEIEGQPIDSALESLMLGEKERENTIRHVKRTQDTRASPDVG